MIPDSMGKVSRNNNYLTRRSYFSIAQKALERLRCERSMIEVIISCGLVVFDKEMQLPNKVASFFLNWKLHGRETTTNNLEIKRSNVTQLLRLSLDEINQYDIPLNNLFIY